jgi:hypothetical protein
LQSTAKQNVRADFDKRSHPTSHARQPVVRQLVAQAFDCRVELPMTKIFARTIKDGAALRAGDLPV